MTSYRKVELALSVFLVALGVGTVLLAYYTIEELSVLRDLIGARGFAYVIGTLIAIGGVFLVLMQTGRIRVASAGGADLAAAERGGDEPEYPASALRVFALVAVLIVYAALMRPAGYLLASIFFMSAGTAIMGGRGLTRLLIVPVTYAIVTYLLFDTLLGVRIPDGILRPLIVAIGLG
jgi:putative tricarboxylic transport membrane protein